MIMRLLIILTNYIVQLIYVHFHGKLQKKKIYKYLSKFIFLADCGI